MSMRTISPLRQSMIDDMTARQMGPKTQKDYIRSLPSCSPSSSAARRTRPPPTTFGAFSWTWPKARPAFSAATTLSRG